MRGKLKIENGKLRVKNAESGADGLPQGWVWSTIQNVICPVSIQIKVKQKDYQSVGSYPVIDQGQEFVGGYLNDASLITKCDLPVVIFGDHTRCIKVATQPFIAGADGIKVFNVNNQMDHKLFIHFLAYIVSKMPSKGYARHYGDVIKQKIPLPPLPVQRKIVAKIEELFSDLDAGVESLKKAQAQLKIYRQSVLKAAFEGKLTAEWRAQQKKLPTAQELLATIQAERQAHYETKLKEWKSATTKWEKGGKVGKKPSKPSAPEEMVPLTKDELKELPKLPEGWGVVHVGDTTLGTDYGSSAKSLKVGRVPVLRMGNIQNGRLVWDDLVFSDDDDEIKEYTLHKFDVLFNRTNSPELVGKTAIYLGEQPALFAGYLVRVNQIPQIVDPFFLNHFLNSSYARNMGNKVKTDGVNQSNINATKLCGYGLPLCSIEEQRQVVTEVESRLDALIRMEAILSEELQKASSLRQSILKRAFEGKLV